MSSTDKYAAMRADLSNLTMKQLREIARAEGITLGYDGSRKDTAIAAIISWRRHVDKDGRPPKSRDWHESGVTAMGGIKKGWS